MMAKMSVVSARHGQEGSGFEHCRAITRAWIKTTGRPAFFSIYHNRDKEPGYLLVHNRDSCPEWTAGHQLPPVSLGLYNTILRGKVQNQNPDGLSPGQLVLSKMSKTFGPHKKVPDIWLYLVLSKMSMETFVHAKKFLTFRPVHNHLAWTFQLYVHRYASSPEEQTVDISLLIAAIGEEETMESGFHAVFSRT
ncbi:hypothetical protein E5288_WYG004679 [Bos mutus]|uniref:Uncharacterized protein n=1 Tax=Bos mutus TaxID=72004 RepID=A0A6B0RTU3_9CETA|nr:hypothetical protein [Bos mutus]